MGPFSQSEVVFDGTTISLRDTMRNIYAQLPSPGHTVDDATEELRAATGLDAPGADFLANDPYRLLMDGVTEGVLVGSGFVGGVECDHLAFRTDLVDWQIWINKSGRPLPLKYVITTKWTTGAPQYTLRLNNWSAAAVDAALFTFAVPKDGTRVDRVQADATGDVSVEVAQ